MPVKKTQSISIPTPLLCSPSVAKWDTQLKFTVHSYPNKPYGTCVRWMKELSVPALIVQGSSLISCGLDCTLDCKLFWNKVSAKCNTCKCEIFVLGWSPLHQSVSAEYTLKEDSVGASAIYPTEKMSRFLCRYREDEPSLLQLWMNPWNASIFDSLIHLF